MGMVPEKTSPSESPRRGQTRMTILLATIIALTLGATVGLGAYTFVYAKGGSYLGNDPNACANCHIMQDHLNGWFNSSHRSVATCNDCHTPAGFIPKYFTKAEHGFFHSLAFTTGEFHDPIQIKARSRAVTENACRRCHQDIVHDIDTHSDSDAKMSCIRCHSGVGHMK
jgi:cytochrome c nitrite reductase small subunit